MNVYKIAYICWNGDNLYSSGKENQHSRLVRAYSQRQAADKLRVATEDSIEITSITMIANEVLD